MTVRFIVRGTAEPKANSRRVVRSRSGKLAVIKSAKALKFFHDAALQIPNLDPPFDVPIKVTIVMYYPDERRDLDASVLLDAMQSTTFTAGGVKRVVRSAIYTNDRLVRELHLYHRIDEADPRCDVTVERL